MRRQGRSAGNQGLAGLLPTNNVNDVWYTSDPAPAANEPAPTPTGPSDAPPPAGEPSDDAPASGGAVEFYASLKHGLEDTSRALSPARSDGSRRGPFASRSEAEAAMADINSKAMDAAASLDMTSNRSWI